MKIKDNGFFDTAKDVGKQLKDFSKTVLTKAAIIVESAAKQYSPYDTHTLQNSITKEIFDEFAIVGTIIEYAPYQEYGTYKMNAQPFMRPALDNNKTRINGIAKAELNKIK